jgi:hypothetical protein
MNSRHRKTLAAVFREPVSASIAWSDVEALFLSLGCEIVEGNGSRVRSDKVGRLAFFHRPHPEKEAKRYQIRDARDYLKYWESNREYIEL